MTLIRRCELTFGGTDDMMTPPSENTRMTSGLKLTVVMGLLLVVIILVVHPLIDLEPTVLRYLQTSGLLFVVFIFLNISGHTQLPLGCGHIVPENSASLRKDSSSLIDLICTRLC